MSTDTYTYRAIDALMVEKFFELGPVSRRDSGEWRIDDGSLYGSGFLAYSTSPGSAMQVWAELKQRGYSISVMDQVWVARNPVEVTVCKTTVHRTKAQTLPLALSLVALQTVGISINHKQIQKGTLYD